MGREGKNGAAALFKLRRNVYDEGRTYLSEGGGIQDLERAMGLAVNGQLFEAGQEAAFVAEGRGMIVVRVASFPIGKNDSFGTKLPDNGSEAELVLAAGLDVGVGDAEGATPTDTKDLRGFGGFFGASFGRAAGTHFARGEVEDAGFVPGVQPFLERAAAGEFHVVGVGGNGEQVKFHSQSPSAF